MTQTLFSKEQSLTKESTVLEPTIVTSHPTLTTYSNTFLDHYTQLQQETSRAAQSTIRVSDMLSTIAYFYERIRNVLEYKGEHVIRRNAIERILKRLLWEHPGHDTERIANVLLRELIWARYIPNDTLPRSKVKDTTKILNKYLYLLGQVQAKGSAMSNSALKEWIWGVASCELEETIDPINRELYVSLMHGWFVDHFQWQDEGLSTDDKNIQLYLAIHRSVAKSDDEILRYHLLLRAYPLWKTHDQKQVEEVAAHFYKLHESIEKHLSYQGRFLLYRQMKRHTAPFEIFKELVNREGTKVNELIKNTSLFEEKIREICAIKYAQIQRRVNRGILRSIIYIFATKVILAMVIEVPYELYRFGHLTWIPLGINIIFPPAMMWLIGMTIKAPGEANTARIIAKLKTVMYESTTSGTTSFSLLKAHQSQSMKNVFAVIYLILFLGVFGAVSYLLLKLNFTFVGIGIFFIFLSLVLLFGFRVRYTAQELKVMGERESLISYLFDYITMPFLSIGVLLSQGLAKLNFLTVILDFLIEAPLKTIIEMVEEWTVFMREKREEVVEVPEP